MPEVIDVLLQLAAVAVLALGGLAIRRLAEWLGLRADGEVRAYLMDGLEMAVEFGKAEARRRLRAGELGGSHVAAEIAADYARQRFPQALTRFGIDSVALDKMVRARMPAPPAGLV